MKEKCKGSILITDIAVFLLIIFTLAFHDMSQLMAVVQVVCSFLIFLFKLSNKTVNMLKIRYVYWLGFFSFYGFLSSLWAEYQTNVFICVRSVLEVIMTGFAILLYINDENEKENVLKFINIGSIILIIRLLIHVPFYAWGTERVGTYIGYGNNSAALVLSYSAICSFYLYMLKNKKINIFYAFVFMVFTLLCGSKKGLLICVFGIGCLIISQGKNMFGVLKKIICMTLIVLVLVLGVMKIEPLYNVLGIRIERMFLALNGENGGDMSTIDRLLFSKRALQVFKENKIIGVGLDNFRYYNYVKYYAHNNYLEIAADLGIIGLVLYYWFPFKILFECAKKQKYTIVTSLLLVILVMDYITVTYETDSVQLFIAMAYGIFIHEKLKVDNRGREE